MDGSNTSQERRAVRTRALRWRFVAASVVMLAACARWPMPLPGVSAADAAPQVVAKSEPLRSASTTVSVATLPDHTDGMRTLGGPAHVRSDAIGAANSLTAHSTASSATEVASSSPSAANVHPAHPAATDTVLAADGATAAGVDGVAATDVRSSIDVVEVASSGGASLTTAAGASSPNASAPNVRDAALHPVTAAVIPGVQRDSKIEEINERAKWWLVGIAATLLLLFTVGRRKRRPQRVTKMNTHRAEPVGPQPSTSPLRTNSTEKPRVRMFSAYEIYAPTHESHRGPWEAPVTTERGFAHRYELGEEVADGLLFVPGLESAESVPAVSHAPDPASFAATVTSPKGIPAEAKTEAEGQLEAVEPTAPLVFLLDPLSASEQTRSESVEPQLAPQATEVPSAMLPPHAAVVLPPVDAALAAIVAIERGAPTAGESPSEAIATDVHAEQHSVPQVDAAPGLSAPAASEVPQPAGATMFAPAELGLAPAAAREPSAQADDPVSAPVPDAAPKPDATRRDPIGLARKLVDAGDYAGALAQLEEAMQFPRPPAEVWVMSALCWWQIARADGGSKAYANAADAMERLLERDPSQSDIWYRAGSCRLLQASGERGAAQRATLDLAVAALRRAAPEGGHADPLRAATLGDALFERALAATDEAATGRAKRMSDAVQVLRDAARVARNPASMASWKLQQALQAQANLLSSTDASKVRLEADAVLAAGVGGASEQERRGWYVAKVENELAHAELAEGATRALHLRTFRENYRDLLTGPDAAPELLLSWLELLALETGHLRGDAARSRFDEGEGILKRLDDLLPGNAHVALARARLLRRRAAQSNAMSRPAALSDAIAGLMPLVERGDAPQLQIEAAELLLDRAACVPSAQAGEEHARAEAMASGLLEDPVFGTAAARCVLQARLGQSAGAIEVSICRRLEALAGNDVRSRWLLARAALRNGAPREACGHCEAASRSGARLDQALVQLWDQASRQWSTTLHGQKDPAWLANRQSLRSAS